MSKNKVTLTTRIKIQPTEAQLSVLGVLSERCRLLYNFSLDEKQKTNTTYRKQQNKLPALKKKYPEYGWVHSKSLQMVIRTLHDNFKSYKQLAKHDSTARPPHFRPKHCFMTMCWNQSGFKFVDNRIKLTHFYDDEKIPLIFDCELDVDPKNVKQVTLSKHKNEYYISITYDIFVEEQPDNEQIQAFDPGIMKTTAVNTHGNFIEVKHKRPDKYWNPKIDSIKSYRDRCKKGSRAWKHRNTIIQKCETKKSNQLKNEQHQTSRRLINNTKSTTIVFGSSEVKQMPKSPKSNSGMNRSTQGTGYMSRFSQFVAYKSTLAGKKYIEIDERGTSKTCYACGKQHDMPVWNRTMCCDCGNTIDRDKNSAINIMLRYLSQNAMWTGYRQFADNLRSKGFKPPQASSSEHPIHKGGVGAK